MFLASCIAFICLCQGAGAHGPEGYDGPVRHRFGHKTHDPAHHGSYDAACSEPTEPPTEKAIPCTVSENNGEISEEEAAYQLLKPYTVRAEGTPEEVLYAFASQAYPEALLSLPEDNPYNPLEYKLLEYGIRETFEDGFVGYILYWTERGSALPIVDAAASRPYKTEEAFQEAYPDLDYNDVNCERVALVPQGDGTWVRVGAAPMRTLIYKTEGLTKQRDPKNKYTIAGQNTLAQAQELID